MRGFLITVLRAGAAAAAAQRSEHSGAEIYNPPLVDKILINFSPYAL